MSRAEPSEIVVKEYTAEFSLACRTQLVYFRTASDDKDALHRLALEALAPKVKTSVDAWRLERLWRDGDSGSPIYLRRRSLPR
jgi:hypothetical protein